MDFKYVGFDIHHHVDEENKILDSVKEIVYKWVPNLERSFD